MFEGVLNTPVFRLHLVMFCVIIANIWWDISNSLNGSRIICLPFSISEKLHWRHVFEKLGRGSSPVSLLVRYNTYASWLTTSTIQTNGNHHHFFIRIPILGHVLVHSVDKTHVLVATVKLIWLMFWNIFSFKFVPRPNKSLRFTRFKGSYVNCPAVVLTNHCQNLLCFFAWCALFKVATFFFCSCLFLMIVHFITYFCWAHVLLECC